MAKKAVATFAAKAGARSIVKCIRMDKSPKTGAYVFVEQFVDAGKEKEFFDTKSARFITFLIRWCVKAQRLFFLYLAPIFINFAC